MVEMLEALTVIDVISAIFPNAYHVLQMGRDSEAFVTGSSTERKWTFLAASAGMS
jgi:hypothetical protein